jgi:CBS domain-containing protein
MAIGEICSREVVFARRDESVAVGATLMRQHHVGCLVIVDETGGKRRPVGIVTDRDIVLAVVAPRVDPETILLGDIMGSELVAVREDAGVAESVDLMRLKGVRRLPVVDVGGALVGLLAADDLILLLAEEMSGLAAMLSREDKQERISRKSTYA